MTIQALKSHLNDLRLEMPLNTKSLLSQEINALVSAGGKKFRPGLLFLMGKVFGLGFHELSLYARAVELTHLASLIHDDVIDESVARRNHPTLNSLKNNTTAILAGDYVLATIMGELAKGNNNELLIDLTKCIQDLADGEWLQYDLKRKTEVSFDDLELICLKKTGSLIRYCCSTPAKLAHFEDIQTMEKLGERIGLIFQMADDIVDGLALNGREAFQDIANGQLNYVTLTLIDLYPELREQVYAYKSGANSTLPWSSTQYHEALKKVHELISSEKNKLISVFSDLCTLKKQSDLVPLFEMSLSKIQTNYTQHLSL